MTGILYYLDHTNISHRSKRRDVNFGQSGGNAWKAAW